jgi:hypothetical protein
MNPLYDKVIKGREWKTKRGKYTYDEVKNIIETEGYTLCDDCYTNSRTKLTVICPKGHKREMRFDNWLAGHRCATCGNHREISSKWSIARKDMEKRGYKVLAEPEKSTAKAKLMCPNGHIFEVSMYNWLRGSRCPRCPRSHRYYNERGFLNLSKNYRKR